MSLTLIMFVLLLSLALCYGFAILSCELGLPWSAWKPARELRPGWGLLKWLAGFAVIGASLLCIVLLRG